MIKNYKLFKESLLDKLKGPTEEEIKDYFKNNPNELIRKSIECNSINKKILSVDNIKRAIEMGADINSSVRGYQGTLLSFVCEVGDYDLVKYLIENGAELELPGYISFSNSL